MTEPDDDARAREIVRLLLDILRAEGGVDLPPEVVDALVKVLRDYLATMPHVDRDG